MAQAEHDPRAAVVVIVTGGGATQQADRIAAAVARLAASTPRHAVVTEALSQVGALLTAADMSEAIAFANEWAAEHLLLIVADPEPIVPGSAELAPFV